MRIHIIAKEVVTLSSNTVSRALETAMERCTALQAEMNKVPVEDRGRLMRAFELLDLLEHALLETVITIKEAK